MRGRYTAREDYLKAGLLSILLLVVPGVISAQEPQGQFGAYHWDNSQLRLPSGDTLTVYRVKLWQFGDRSAPALQLEYEPPFSVSDVPAVRRHLDQVWPAFAPYVEARHLTNAIVTATNLVRHGAPPLPWTATFKSYGFVLTRSSDGTWRVQGEPAGTTLPPSLSAETFLIFRPDGSRLTP